MIHEDKIETSNHCGAGSIKVTVSGQEGVLVELENCLGEDSARIFRERPEGQSDFEETSQATVARSDVRDMQLAEEYSL